jgi:hypothetical protein
MDHTAAKAQTFLRMTTCQGLMRNEFSHAILCIQNFAFFILISIAQVQNTQTR